ncbi:hypothetical protein [Escherichia coli]|uniref:hypothetical protein n=1 Tax=Escherichia coli TaxID=562 RepID=UPI000F163FD5|nr:hypothetical protein [Escherichia coli]VCZ42374.1 hypothetical protein BANRA_03239 [Escherichia coli]
MKILLLSNMYPSEKEPSFEYLLKQLQISYLILAMMLSSVSEKGNAKVEYPNS